jgi:Rrf2 family protein
MVSVKLTTKSEYSILALIYMARHEKKGFIKLEKICSKCNIPENYLVLLFSILRQERYVKTRRGAGGGYKLAKPASKISIAEIIRVMDGALAPTESVSKYFFSSTPLGKEKKIIKVFKEIRDYISDRLEALTLADLI